MARFAYGNTACDYTPDGWCEVVDGCYGPCVFAQQQQETADVEF